ncbi:MAG: lysophospholipid acyltransferase family protein [Gammaproteobacteria bacterium]|jgi:KDO2-lipid IV(A) lauroyltransferase|nr:lysophospholipid acyltransferase family protein [Gammaproteobacteria bacterium]
MPEFYLVPKELAHKVPLLARVAHRVEAFIFRSMFSLVRHLRLETALRISGKLFYFMGRFSNKKAKALANLKIAFPDKSEQWYEETAREIFRSLGYAAVELIKLDQIWEEREQRIEYVLEPGAQRHMENGGATVFMTAHLGAWQVAPLITREYNFPINIIYAPESNPAMNEVMQNLRTAIGDKLIAATAGPRPIMKALNRGESLVMAVDTRPDTGKLVPFFGKDALANTSVIGLGLRSKAALVIARADRLPQGRYRITMLDPIEAPDREADVKEQSIEITRIIHGHFEQWIRQYPQQWICLKRRWPKAHKL